LLRLEYQKKYSFHQIGWARWAFQRKPATILVLLAISFVRPWSLPATSHWGFQLEVSNFHLYGRIDLQGDSFDLLLMSNYFLKAFTHESLAVVLHKTDIFPIKLRAASFN